MKVQKNQIRAVFGPESYDAETRTLEVVASTGARGVRWNWDGRYLEELAVDTKSIRLDRFNTGAPVLNSHSSYNLKDVIGVLESARIENGQLIAQIKMSNRADVAPIVQDIRDGIIRSVSVGYRVHKYEKTEGTDKELPIYRAIDWEPYELSFVAIPFDAKAQVRSVEDFEEVEVAEIVSRGTTETELTPAPATEPEIVSRGTTPILTKPNAGTNNREMDEKQLLEQERTRVAEITRLSAEHSMPTDFATRHIAGGTDLAEVRAEILADVAKRTQPISGAISGIETRAQFDTEVENSILSRVGATNSEGKLITGDFSKLKMERLVAEFLRNRGHKPETMTGSQIAQRAMSTSDFPLILGNTIGRQLRRAYELAQPTFAQWTRRDTASDFRMMYKVQLSNLVGSFDLVTEGGEYKAGSMTGAQEAYKVAKYGKVIPYTWEMIVNDDLSAFSRIPQAAANGAVQKQSDLVYAILTGNPNMADNNALFSVAHGNLAGTATGITAAGLAAAMAAMRVQKDMANNFLNVQPRYLICGPAKEQEALQLLNGTYMPTAKETAVTPWMRSLVVIVEPRLTGNQWYLAADPAAIDTIEYSFLDGEAFFTESEMDFNTDTYKVKARTVFGTKAIDWRGLYKNAGA